MSLWSASQNTKFYICWDYIRNHLELILDVLIEQRQISVDSFQIDEDRLENTYTLNLNISLCLESTGECVVHSPVLTNLATSKKTCDWTTGFKQKGAVLKKGLNYL